MNNNTINTYGYIEADVKAALSPDMAKRFEVAQATPDDPANKALLQSVYDTYMGMRGTSSTGQLKLDDGAILEKQGVLLSEWNER